LGGILGNLASNLQKLGDLAAAEDHQRRAVAVFERLSAEHPESARFHGDLGYTLDDLGQILAGRECYEEAVAMHRRAIAEQRQALALAPNSAQIQFWLTNHHANLVRALAALGRVDAALRAAREARELGRRHPWNT